MAKLMDVRRPQPWVNLFLGGVAAHLAVLDRLCR
jgi:hypothetical protein